MSELGSSMPSRAAIMSVIGTLEGLRPASAAAAPTASPAVAPVPPPAAPEPVAASPVAQPALDSPAIVPPVAQPAAQAHSDQQAAALRDMTAERDAWRNDALSLRHELAQQLEAIRLASGHYQAATAALHSELDLQREELDQLRAEAQTRDGRIAHLGAAITALVELAHAGFDPAGAGTSGPAPTTPAPATPVRKVAARAADDVPRTQPPAPEVDVDAPPMVVPGLAPESAPLVEKPRLGVGRVKMLDRPLEPADGEPPRELTPAAQVPSPFRLG